jgi:hypothetical protein
MLPGGDLVARIDSRMQRSSDLGATWQDVGPFGVPVAHIAIEPGGGPWYVFSTQAAFRSSNQGASWTPVPRGAQDGNLAATIVGAGGAVLVAWSSMSDFVRRSVDGGQTWATVTMPGGLQVGIGRFVRGRAGVLYAISYPYDSVPTASRDAALFRSVDDGATWSLESTDYIAGVAELADGSRMTGLAEGLDGFTPDLDAGGPCEFVELASGVILATSCGYTIGSFDPPSSSWSASGIYRLDPGGTQWEQAGMERGPVHALAMASGELLAGGDGAVHRARDSAWTAAGWNQGSVARMMALAEGATLVSGPRASPLVLFDDGVYTSVNIPTCDDGCWTGALGRSASGALFIAVTEWYYFLEEGLYRSVGIDSTWTRVLPDISNLTAFAASEDGLLVVGARGVSAGPNGYDDGIYVSTDDGMTWAPAVSDPPDPDIRSLYAEGGGIAYAGTESGVARSTDWGATWTLDGLANDTVYAMAVTSHGLLAGTGSGLYVRTTRGWQPIGSGLDGLGVLALLVHEDADGELIVLGTESGVFATRTLVTTDSDAPAPERVSSLSLGPPRPNPSATAASVSVNTPTAGSMRVWVHDVLGREVLSLEPLRVSAGSHEVRVPTEGLPVGVYVLRVEASGVYATRLLTVAR